MKVMKEVNICDICERVQAPQEGIGGNPMEHASVSFRGEVEYVDVCNLCIKNMYKWVEFSKKNDISKRDPKSSFGRQLLQSLCEVLK